MAERVALTIVSAVALTCVGAVAFVAVPGALDVFATTPIAQSSAPETQSSAPETASQPVPAPPSAQQPATRLPIPDVEALVVLIRNAIVALHQANIAGNYSVLRAIAAPGFQQANNPASLSQAFADLRNRGLDLGQITVANPRLYTDPVINEQGILRLVGFFPAGAEQVNFDLVYQPVGGRWRLFGIGVYPPKSPDPVAGGQDAPKAPKPKTAEKAKLPDAAAIVVLVRSAVIALNQANMAGDYSVLRDISASGFQQENSLPRIGEIFADLRARQLDLGPVAVIVPTLFRPAAIDKQGYLRLAGFFPSRPEQVNFDLAFQFSDGQWRLFGIGLNTSRATPAASTSNLDQPGSTDAGSAKGPPIPRQRPSQ